MFLDTFFKENKDYIWISQEQSSQFAKEVCADFNPIHDPGAKRFCVPGDLLFALALTKYGLSQKMSLNFLGMVRDNTRLYLPLSDSNDLTVKDQHDNVVLEIKRRGDTIRNSRLIEAMIRCYVTLSGRNFPDLLVPVLRKHGIMFNPKRPLVLYDSMWFEFEHSSFEDLQIELAAVELENEGKRATEYINFNFFSANKHIGYGQKKVIISGLKPYDDAQMQSFAEGYNALRDDFYLSNSSRRDELNWQNRKGNDNSSSCSNIQ